MLATTPFFAVYGAEIVDRKLFGLLPAKLQGLRTLDDKGVIRLQTRNGVVRSTTAGDADKVLAELAEEHAYFGDAGRILPDMMLLAGTRIIDLTGIADPLQIVALARTELANFAADTAAVVMAGLP